ncbi:hypothetical protein CNMCM8980_010168 [Aspergillus fumigatiaffinis]|uniref:Alcohol dehydrogenase n=1 Tax=Aspergillus fumigatiaffinis TaxID=340414 RepID=A0A8H4ECX5_9EURO|nr:hypothetical protein CNMCM6457_004880 [Aspergillus fumigatiaffinis]KAF4226229.1 hypothetical protein CNMCM6805_004891 [Aspergillus fumigatiaffinis]KAF4250846.1 hypothetical protein CNMCM8980_010168 [Aspergillus fumigatiaffinis]
MTGKEYTIYKHQGDRIIEVKAQIPALGPKDILIRITHSGVCNADAAFAKRGACIALGHEGVGIVEAVGSDVTQFQVGERAGGGGGFIEIPAVNVATSCLVVTFYVLTGEHAAPLQCAGATTFKALKATIKPGNRVGIVGIGGLGHLAIQFATYIGATVVALSTSQDKKMEALELGAKEFVNLNELDVKAPLDVIVLTSSKYPDFGEYVLCYLTNESSDSSKRRYCGTADVAVRTYDPSYVASRAEHDEMLEFAARHGIRPTVQL